MLPRAVVSRKAPARTSSARSDGSTRVRVRAQQFRESDLSPLKPRSRRERDLSPRKPRSRRESRAGSPPPSSLQLPRRESPSSLASTSLVARLDATQVELHASQLELRMFKEKLEQALQSCKKTEEEKTEIQVCWNPVR